MESFGLQSSNAQKQLPSLRLFVVVCVCCCSPLLFGFSLCFTSPAQGAMEGKAKGKDPEVLPPEGLIVFTASQFSMYAALFNVGAVVGAFTGGPLMERVGRKHALVISGNVHCFAWLANVFTSSPAILTLLRVLAGIAVGMGSAITPCYISEVSTISLRGSLGAAHQLSVNLGIFLVNALGAYASVVEVEGQTFCNWRLLSLFGLGFALVLSTMAFMPESPKWLASQGRVQEANLALKMLRTGDMTLEEAELQHIADVCTFVAESEGASVSSTTSMRTHRLIDYKRCLVVAIGLMAFQQLSGFNAIMMYTNDICAQAGMGNAEFSTMVVMMAQVVLTMLSCMLVETVGRRSLLQLAGFTMCLSHLGLSYYYLAKEHALWGPPWLSLLSLSMFVVGYSIGMAPIPWIILAEIFPVEVVGTASSMATAVGWFCSLVVCWTFHGLQVKLGADGAFMLFAFSCFACFVFVTALLPETKSKTLEQVLWVMRGPSRSIALMDRRIAHIGDPKMLGA